MSTPSSSKHKMVCSSVEKRAKKPMSRDEAELLIDLITRNPLLLSRETNAHINKIKDETWDKVLLYFNGVSQSYRSKEQLKFKWDNLKKAARKRSHQIQVNSNKTGGEKPEDISQDEILDKVISLLGSPCTAFEVPLVVGDGVGPSANEEEDIVVYRDGNSSCLSIPSSESPIEDASINSKCSLEFGDLEENSNNIPAASELHINKDTHTTNKKRVLDYRIFVGDNGEVVPPAFKMRKFKDKKIQNVGILERNKAIARYYDKKTEKIELEIELLKIELAKKKTENTNGFNK